MSVSVTIDRCDQCKYHQDGRGWGDDFCHNARRELINTYIPDWCPLRRKKKDD